MLPGKKIILQVGILFLLIGLIVFIILKYFRSSLPPNLFRSSTPVSSPSPLPSPRPIPHGKKGFTISQSDKTVPQFSRGFIDPYDPAKGATQTVTIAVKHEQPITKVTAVLKTDHAVSSPVLFTLTSGTNTNGEWSASWRITDTYLYIYRLVLQAESSRGKPASVEITLR